MALGSSAPEILLSTIELTSKRFESGELGPGTIVGSAAFNLLIIPAVCIVSNTGVKSIKYFSIFLTTSLWSITAYVWMFLVLVVISPNQVEIWEAFVTLSLFPVFVFNSYVVDKYFSKDNYDEENNKERNVEKANNKNIDEVEDLNNSMYLQTIVKQLNNNAFFKIKKEFFISNKNSEIEFSNNILHDCNVNEIKISVKRISVSKIPITFQIKSFGKRPQSRINIDAEFEMNPEENEKIIIVTVTPNVTNETVILKLKSNVHVGNNICIIKIVGNHIKTEIEKIENWQDQIKNAIDQENVNPLLHIISFYWKIVFALVPPPHLFGGWLCFFISLFIIGWLTAAVGDLAVIFGCIIGLKDTVTAISLVTIGTSFFDVFASQISSKHEKYADNAIGNVNGSNCVNVFLGLGIPWVVGSLYWKVTFYFLLFTFYFLKIEIKICC
jgi:Ca2+/Na+ antiporter